MQSALLEAMAERQVSVGQHTYPLPEPFLVMATQNPIEQEGTYPLPEAQLDRFLMQVNVQLTLMSSARSFSRSGSKPCTDRPNYSINLSIKDIFQARREILSLQPTMSRPTWYNW